MYQTRDPCYLSIVEQAKQIDHNVKPKFFVLFTVNIYKPRTSVVPTPGMRPAVCLEDKTLQILVGIHQFYSTDFFFLQF